jgi:hypothetical protein
VQYTAFRTLGTDVFIEEYRGAEENISRDEDGQLTETCKGNKYLQIESHWTVLIIIL